MNTKEMTREQISAFVDGELADQHTDIVLAALRQTDNRTDWETYHQIGDVLRSDDMDVKLSAGFAARMAARLDAEPAIVAPGLTNAGSDLAAVQGVGQRTMTAKRSVRRWAVPGMVATAAMATMAFVTTPQLMVAMKGESVGAGVPHGASQVMTVSADSPAQKAVAAGTVPVEAGHTVVAANGPDGVVLRDPRIDEYLMAHQRFSPSVFSTAHYARSATLATTDSSK